MVRYDKIPYGRLLCFPRVNHLCSGTEGGRQPGLFFSFSFPDGI